MEPPVASPGAYGRILLFDPSLASRCLQQNCWKSWCVEVDNRSITRWMCSGAAAAQVNQLLFGWGWVRLWGRMHRDRSAILEGRQPQYLLHFTASHCVPSHWQLQKMAKGWYVDESSSRSLQSSLAAVVLKTIITLVEGTKTGDCSLYLRPHVRQYSCMLLVS